MADNDNIMFKSVRKWKIVENSGRHVLIIGIKSRMNEFLLQRIYFPVISLKL